MNATDGMARHFREMLDRKQSFENLGLLKMKSGNDFVEDGLRLPDPVLYFHGLIAENEITVLFSKPGVGKSILAVQIGVEIAKVKPVLYIDLELSVKQFQKRYTVQGIRFNFPDNFKRAEFNTDDPITDGMEEGLLESIELAAQKGIPVVILDNITYACPDAERADSATIFMQRLKHLKESYRITLIILSHTPKIPDYRPLTLNDLAGSHKLMAFVDSAVALARVPGKPSQRYIKQVKVRSSEAIYDGEHVALLELVDSMGWLHMEFIGEASENELLYSAEHDPRIDEASALHSEGKSLREIAAIMSVGKSTVSRWLKEKTVPGVPTVPSVPGAGQTGQTGQWDTNQRQYEEKLPLPPAEV